jgi:FkbM family methyltransferase
MMNKIFLYFFTFRRKFLIRIVPELFWPVHVEKNGMKVPVRNMPWTFGVKYSIWVGNYERLELELLDKYIKKGDHIFELGASIGIVTRFLSEKIGPKGFIYSFEASNDIYTANKALMVANNLSYQFGFAFPVLQMQNQNFGFETNGSSLGGKVVKKIVEKLEENTDVYTLKRLQEEFNFHPTVLVCDIEGSESTILDQTFIYPSSIRLIVIELHPKIYGDEILNSIIEKFKEMSFYLQEFRGDVYVFTR